jgi:hypothetical protein
VPSLEETTLLSSLKESFLYQRNNTYRWKPPTNAWVPMPASQLLAYTPNLARFMDCLFPSKSTCYLIEDSELGSTPNAYLAYHKGSHTEFCGWVTFDHTDEIMDKQKSNEPRDSWLLLASSWKTRLDNPEPDDLAMFDEVGLEVLVLRSSPEMSPSDWNVPGISDIGPDGFADWRPSGPLKRVGVGSMTGS